MKCEKCGNEMPSNGNFCTICGNPSAPSGASSPIKKPKKKRRGLKFLAVLLVLAAVSVVCIKIFLPGLLSPKDLGIKTSEAAYQSAVSKLSYVKDEAPAGTSEGGYVYTYGELADVKASLTSEELTSFFNYNRPEYYALKKVQIKVNPDNTLAFSGEVDTEYFLNKVLGGKYSEQDLENAFPLASALPKSINVYATLSGEIANNKSQGFALSDIEVMGITIPTSLYETQSAQAEITSLLDNFLAKTTEKTGGAFKSVKIENGELHIDGRLPTSLTREVAD